MGADSDEVGRHHDGPRHHSPPAVLPPAEEPSALLFMSPMQPNTTSSPSSRHHPSNPKKQKKHKKQPQSACGDGEDDTTGSVGDSRTHTDASERMMCTRAEAEQLVRRTLEAYERRRDEEEERVLAEIKSEMKLLNDKREAAERRAAEAVETLRQEQEIGEKLEAQCRMLSHTTQEMHDELLVEKQRAKELDINACHAEDRRRAEVADLRRELEFERGQTKALKEECEHRAAQSLDEHQRELEQVRFRAHEAGSAVTELEAQLKATRKTLADEERKREQLEHRLRDTEAALERTIRDAKESESLRQTLERKSTVVEKREQSKTGELQTLQAHVKHLEEAVRALNDDVRKKLHRIQTLEGDVHRARDEVVAAAQERDGVLEHRMLLHASVESLWSTLKSGVRKQVSSALEQLRSADSDEAAAAEDDDDDRLDLFHQLREEIEGSEDATAAVVVAPTGGESTAGGIKYHRRAFRPSTTAARGKSPRSTSAPTRRPAGGLKSTAPDTLRILNNVHEKTNVLLRKLHIRSAETAASSRENRQASLKQEKEFQQSKERCELLSSEKEALSTQVRSLERELRSTSEELQSKSADVLALSEELRCTRAHCQHWEHRWKTQDFELSEVRTSLALAHQSTRECTQRLESKERELEKTAAELQNDRAQLDGVKRELLAKGTALENADQLLLKSSREVGDVLQQKEKLQRQTTKLHSELAHCRSELTKAHDEAVGLQGRVSKLEGQLSLARKSANRLAGKQEQSSEASQHELATLRAQLQNVSEQASATERELQSTSKKLQQYRARLSSVLERNEHTLGQCQLLVASSVSLLRDHCEAICATLAATNPLLFAQHVVNDVRPMSRSLNAAQLDPFALHEATPANAKSSSVDVTTALMSVSQSAPIFSAHASLDESCTALDAVSREVVRAWTVYHSQKQQELRNLQQTNTFLELEIRCHSSQFHHRNGSTSSRSSSKRAPTNSPLTKGHQVLSTSPIEGPTSRMLALEPDEGTSGVTFTSPPPMKPMLGVSHRVAASMNGITMDLTAPHLQHLNVSKDHHRASRVEDSLTPAADVLEPPSSLSVLDAVPMQRANSVDHQRRVSRVTSPRDASFGPTELSTTCVGPPSPSPPRTHHDGHQGGEAPVTKRLASVGGSGARPSSSSRSVDGLSESPMRPPSLR